MIQPQQFRSGQLEFQPIAAETARALLAGDTGVVAAAPGWPHGNTMLGLRMAQESGDPFWLIVLNGSVIGDCGTLGQPDAEGEVEIGCGLSGAYESHRSAAVRGLTGWLHGQPGVTNVVGEPEQNFAEPPVTLTDPGTLLAEYLDHYRDTVLRKLDGMTDEELRAVRVPSGWTPLGLLNHLTLMERRWFRWGFLAEQIAEPWGGGGPGSDWRVPLDRTGAALIEAFRAETARSRKIVADSALDTVAAVGGRFSEFGDRPTLIWILFHVLQEYARHAGHLDIVRELSDGTIGE